MTDDERRMIGAWAQLMGLSLAMAALSESGFGLLPRSALMALLGAVVTLKSRIILREYLALREQPAAALAFLIPIAILIGAIITSFLLIGRPHGA